MSDPDVMRIRKARARAAIIALGRAAEHVLGQAARDAPVEEGTLRGSGTVTYIVEGAQIESRAAAIAAAEAAVTRSNTVRLDAVVTFATPYAARQHEETGWRHPKGGRAKYLESALMQDAKRLTDYIAAAQRAAG